MSDVYIYSTRQNNNSIYKNDPVQKFTYPWILILCVVTWMIHDCFSVLWWLFMSPLLVLSNPPAPAHSLFFKHFLHIWTLSNSDSMILRSIFSHWGQLRDSYTTITKGGDIYWCSTQCIKRYGDGGGGGGGVKTVVDHPGNNRFKI